MITAQKLRSLGLSEKEVQVYLTLNKIGPTPVAVLARLTHINRTTTYDVLEKLVEKELVISFKQAGTVFFALDDVRKLVSRERDQMETAQEVVKELIAEQGGSATHVQYYKGREGIKELMEDILHEAKGPFCFWANTGFLHDTLGFEYMSDWIARRAERKLFARMLLEKSEFTLQKKKTEKKEERSIRFVPENCLLHSACFIFDENICLVDSSENMLAVRIRNVILADTHRSLFEFMWGSAES